MDIIDEKIAKIDKEFEKLREINPDVDAKEAFRTGYAMGALATIAEVSKDLKKSH